MSPPVIAAALWVLVATGVALLPMRFQYIPGAALLLVAPVLLVWIGAVHGVWVALAATLAVLSMFRRPLREVLRRARGQK
ncbi:DUF2484 family protein [Aquicoccus sp. SU-CL01552]|uniref:DUF2484 family protein n=1 Tax=Aquicoccus sp. SU-CL01552 TaxID=3127656 RepID=UPI0031078CDC